MDEKFVFTLPAKKEHLTIIRLTTSAIANKMNFNIEQIEDLKVCISEVCNLVIKSCETDLFKIEYVISDERIEIIVSAVENDINMDDSEETEMSRVILEALVDDVEFSKNSIKLKLNLK